MKIHSLFLLLVMLPCSFSCKKNGHPDAIIKTMDSNSIINDSLLTFVKEFEAEHGQQKEKYPIAIYFTDSVSSSSFLSSDTIVIVSCFDMHTNFPIKYYKGTLHIDSISIVIYDKDSIGTPYYDVTKLTQEQVKKTNLDLLIMSAFVIKHGELHKWHPPL